MLEFSIENNADLQLAHIFECGQCFRWKKQNDESYIGILKNGIIKIKEEKNHIIIKTNIKNKEEILEYFDLNRDYGKIKKQISKNDKAMKQAIDYGYGIRILNQDPWEMLISFIISSANNIPRISKTIESISKAYGKKIKFEGEEYYLFPTPNELAKASVQDLRKLNLGFRDKYVYLASQAVAKGEIDLDKISKLTYKEAKKELTKISGVGAKVADCILLFSMKKAEAFPVDTWIKKVMNELYVESENIKQISDFANKRFGAYAGIAQQYLFYWRRENKKLD